VIRVQQPKVCDLQERSNKSNSSNQKRHVKTENAHNTANNNNNNNTSTMTTNQPPPQQNQPPPQQLWSPNAFLEMPILKVAPEAMSFFCQLQFVQ
jgi:hypothetical protein